MDSQFLSDTRVQIMLGSIAIVTVVAIVLGLLYFKKKAPACKICGSQGIPILITPVDGIPQGAKAVYKVDGAAGPGVILYLRQE